MRKVVFSNTILSSIKNPTTFAYDAFVDCTLLKCDLSGAVFIDAVLINVNLTGSNLTGANLIYADLTSANLTDANLREANLQEANLRFANLTSADLRLANLRFANLTSADLTDAVLQGANLIYADLTGAKLINAKLISAVLENSDLTDADLTDANLTDAILTNTKLIRANLTRTDLTRAILTYTTIIGIRGYADINDLITRGAWNDTLDNTPALLPQGIAFEIHNAFTTFKINDYISILEKLGQKLGYKQTNLPYATLIKQLTDRMKNITIEKKKRKEFDGNLQTIYDTIKNIKLSENQIKATDLTVQYMLYKANSSPNFFRLYTDAFVYDCMNAYTTLASDKSSCTKGMAERVILSIREPVISFCGGDKNSANLCTEDIKSLLPIFKELSEEDIIHFNEQIEIEWRCNQIKTNERYMDKTVSELDLTDESKQNLINSLEEAYYMFYKPISIGKTDDEIKMFFTVYFNGIKEIIDSGDYEFTNKYDEDRKRCVPDASGTDSSLINWIIL